MKNLLKILLILAFSAPVFADMPTAQMPDLASVTTDAIMKMSSANVDGWLASLTADQYGMLKPDVQKWMNSLKMEQYNVLKPEVQALVTMPSN